MDFGMALGTESPQPIRRLPAILVRHHSVKGYHFWTWHDIYPDNFEAGEIFGGEGPVLMDTRADDRPVRDALIGRRDVETDRSSDSER